MLKTDMKTNLKKQLKTIKIILILYTGLCSAQCFNNDDEHLYKQLKIQHMDNLTRLQEHLNVKISSDFARNTGLEISTWNTADGYDLFVMTEDAQTINWESDVFYYAPSFKDIIERIKDLPEGSTVYIDDIEERLPDYELEDFFAELDTNENE